MFNYVTSCLVENSALLSHPVYSPATKFNDSAIMRKFSYTTSHHVRLFR